MSSIETVVRFFHNIFRLQTESAESQPAADSFRMIAQNGNGERIYELYAGSGSHKKTRRMSIRQIGETVESKSTCFKVIYDELLVVKLPPRAFADFEVYLKHISTEKAIARRLAPAVSCLYPAISGILKKIPRLDPTGRHPLEDEADYVRLLIKRPGLQSHLKIDGRFAFFMDLSRYAFLNQVINIIHDKNGRAAEAILKNGEALFSLDAFETLYGAGHEDIFFAANQLYYRYQDRIEKVMASTEGLLSIPDYLKEEWFIGRMAGRTPDIAASGYSLETAEKIKQALLSSTEQDKNAIGDYRKLVISHVGERAFHSNQAKMSALITNTLELVSRLKDRGVAIRDLKADNIYVAKNFDGADHLLGDPRNYELGLIDLETAVSLDSKHPEKLEQPLMAGTPSFMTPSQLFSNRALIELFQGDTARVLYMQDWFAVVGIIYNIITGEHLFQRTAKLIPEIVRLKQKSPGRPPDIFKQVSWNFWYTAFCELDAKVNENRARLERLHILITPPIARAVSAEAETEMQRLLSSIKRLIEQQRFFPEKRKALAAAPAQIIRKNRIKRESMRDAGHGTERAEAEIDFLKSLETLKSQLSTTRSLLDLKEGHFSAEETLYLLFTRAFYAMYDPLWSERLLPVAAGA
jgi:serine/threonine protein kinase